MIIVRNGSAVWNGGVRDGRGAISTQSRALDNYPYAFVTRFGDKPGTNPEELIAAAHAGCFTMALTRVLGDAGFVADALNTSASVSLEKLDDGYAITAVHLKLTARIPGMAEDVFQRLSATAKAGCPVSKLLKAEVTLEAELIAEAASPGVV